MIICVQTVENTTTPVTAYYEEMTAIATTQNATKTEGITALVTTQQGTSTSITTQMSPTLNQDTYIQHRSLIVVAGNNVSLSCSSSVKTKFRWEYFSLESSQSVVIYTGNRINRDFHGEARVSTSSCNDRNCTFNVDDVQLDDAGYFFCIRKTVRKDWSLTVLGK